MLKQILFVVLVFVLLTWVPFIQRHFIYFPTNTTPDHVQELAEDMEDISLITADGLTLHAWYKAPVEQNPVILYLPGNAGNRGYRVRLARFFMNAGLGVLLLDYRGYGGNPGKPSEAGLYQDGRAGMKFLKTQTHPVVLYGESLGTGVATQLATEFPICALVLQSPFTSMTALARNWYPWLPILVKDRFNSIQKIKTVRRPVLILHGVKDTIVPYQQGLELFKEANKPREIVSFPKKGHNDLWDENFAQKVIAFIQGNCVPQ
jgi:fermentation-respiration switch protein FrsA (DUF1100 family)